MKPQPTTINQVKIVEIHGKPMTLYSADGKSWVSNPIELASYHKRQLTAQREVVLDDNIIRDDQPLVNQQRITKQPTRVRGYNTKVTSKRKPAAKQTPMMQLGQRMWFT